MEGQFLIPVYDCQANFAPTQNLPKKKKLAGLKEGTCVFGYWVTNLQRYGVVEFNKNNEVISIEEKPKYPKSNYAVTGLYFYDNEVVNIAKNLKPSARGELEITDVNLAYLKKGNLKVELLGRGVMLGWIPVPQIAYLIPPITSLLMERRQGLKIGCIEEVAFRMGYIDNNRFERIIEKLPVNDYRKYLEMILKEEQKIK